MTGVGRPRPAPAPPRAHACHRNGSAAGTDVARQGEHYHGVGRRGRGRRECPDRAAGAAERRGGGNSSIANY